MSTKSSIFLTNDCDEHYYSDCSEPVIKDGVWKGDVITMEIHPDNGRILSNNDEGIILEFTNPDSEIYKLIKSIRQK